MAKSLKSTKLSLKKDQRRALVKSLTTSLAINESIITTKPKAKALKPHFERLITKAKTPNLNRYRQIRAEVTTETAAKKIVEDFGKRFAKRSGGYLKQEAHSWRLGDDSQLVKLSLTEKPVSLPTKTSKEVSGGQAKPAKSKPVKAKV